MGSADCISSIHCNFEDFSDDLAVFILPFGSPAHGPLIHDIPVEDKRMGRVVVEEVPKVLRARRFGAEVYVRDDEGFPFGFFHRKGIRVFE